MCALSRWIAGWALAIVGAIAATRLEAQTPLSDTARTTGTTVDSANSDAVHSVRHEPRAIGTLSILVSLGDRRLIVFQEGDTLLAAPIAVARGVTFAHGTHRWEFRTPRGERRVRRKVSNPVWVPPDWHYAETARNHDLGLARLPRGGVRLENGARLVVQDSVVGLLFPGEAFAPLPTDEHIVFDNTLFIPPLGTVNRRVEGDLGGYALDLGDGYLIHGTTDQESIGRASTHGCIRIGDEDLAWLYLNIPVGTRVTIK